MDQISVCFIISCSTVAIVVAVTMKFGIAFVFHSLRARHRNLHAAGELVVVCTDVYSSTRLLLLLLVVPQFQLI